MRRLSPLRNQLKPDLCIGEGLCKKVPSFNMDVGGTNACVKDDFVCFVSRITLLNNTWRLRIRFELNPKIGLLGQRFAKHQLSAASRTSYRTQ